MRKKFADGPCGLVIERIHSKIIFLTVLWLHRMGFEQICLELILAPLKLLYPEWVIADLVVF